MKTERYRGIERFTKLLRVCEEREKGHKEWDISISELALALFVALTTSMIAKHFFNVTLFIKKVFVQFNEW